MGFFSFLEQDDPTLLDPNKGLPKKPDFEDDEATNAADQSDQIGSLKVEKPYTQRRGETSSKVFQVADKIIGKYEKIAPYELRGAAEQTKREVRANPENAAKAVEKFFETAQKVKPPQRLNDPEYTKVVGGADFSKMPSLYDNDFSLLENSVRSLRTMKRGAEETALSGGLAETDLKKNVSELQNLKGQLDTLTKDIATAQDTMPEAVSKYGELQNKKTLADKQQKAAALSEHIRQLEKVTGQPQPDVNQEVQGQPDTEVFPEPTPGIEKPVTHFMKGLGIDEEELTGKLHNALKAVGIPKEQWNDQVDPRAGLLRVLSELDKSGILANSIAQQLTKAKQDDANDAAKNQGGDELDAQRQMNMTRQEIQSREQRMRQLYSQLRESPFMHTWPGIILYVLVGMITQNPAFAAKLIGGVDAGDRARIGNEIKGIQFEINRRDRDLEHQAREALAVRQEASRRLQHERDRDQDYGRDLQKLFINHQLILERAKERSSPQMRMIVSKIEGDYNRVVRQMSEAEKIMNNNWLGDDDPKKVRASREYDQYKKEANFLDQKLRSLTEQLSPGTYTEAEK